MTSFRRIPVLAAAAVLVLGLALAGCAANDGAPAGSPSPTPPASPTASPSAVPSATGTSTATPASTSTPAATATSPAATPTAPPQPTHTPTATTTPVPTPAPTPPPLEPPAGGSGLYGVVTVGPMCPVVREGEPCPDHRYEGTLRIVDASGREVALVEANGDGEYAVTLSPGSYRVEPLSPPGSPLPAAGPVNVTVDADAWTRLDIAYDSGIR